MKDPRFPKSVVVINSLVPLALLLWDAYYHHLGTNPVEYAIRTTGMLALIFLILCLTVTPLRKITGKNWLSHFRKMLGLFAFFYACLHLSTYFWLDRSLSIASVIQDTRSRPFILIGMTALLLMVPLALTSTNGMIKRMGSKNWKRLHTLVYPSAIAGVAHYYMLVKADTRKPIAFAVTLGILLGYRLLADRLPFLKARKPAPVPRPQPATA
jgi:DMSO/TMAO reductase YedYZ heme-binding membrane subunit